MREARLVVVIVALILICGATQAGAANSEFVKSVASSTDQITRTLSEADQQILEQARTISPQGTAVPRDPMSMEPLIIVGGKPVHPNPDKDAQGVDLDLGILYSTLDITIEYTGTVSETWHLYLTDLPGCSVDPESGIFHISGTQYSTFTLDRTIVAEGEYYGEILLDWGMLEDQVFTVHFTVADAFWLTDFSPPAGTILTAGDSVLFEHHITVVLWTQPSATMYFELTDDQDSLLEPTETADLPEPGIYGFTGDEITEIPFGTDYVMSATYLVRAFDGSPAAYFQQPYAVKGACDCPSQADMSDDDQLDNVDLNLLISVLFLNGSDTKDPLCPFPRSDFNCNNVSDNVDLNLMISHLFLNGAPPCNPCEP